MDRTSFGSWDWYQYKSSISDRSGWIPITTFYLTTCFNFPLPRVYFYTVSTSSLISAAVSFFSNVSSSSQLSSTFGNSVTMSIDLPVHTIVQNIETFLENLPKQLHSIVTSPPQLNKEQEFAICLQMAPLRMEDYKECSWISRLSDIRILLVSNRSELA